MSWTLVTHRRGRAVQVQYVLPVDDAIPHVEAAGCWCRPTYVEEVHLYVHHSADGRERDEADALPPAVRH